MTQAKRSIAPLAMLQHKHKKVDQQSMLKKLAESKNFKSLDKKQQGGQLKLEVRA